MPAEQVNHERSQPIVLWHQCVPQAPHAEPFLPLSDNLEHESPWLASCAYPKNTLLSRRQSIVIMTLLYFFMKKFFKFVGLAVMVLAVLIFTRFPWWVEARNDRDWNADQAILPEISRSGDLVTIKNIRNFSYQTDTTFTPAYYDATYNITELQTVDFIVEPFAGVQGAAHTFVTFGFADGRHLAISVEIRKEKGEHFSPWKGMLRQYEIMYVIADERDVIKLRSNYRHDQVFLYPIKTTPEKAQALFESMLARAQKTAVEPEFYHTILSNCTTNIADHVNAISPARIPWTWTQLLPADADKTIYDLGLINTDLPFEQARDRFNINERAAKYADAPDFSQKIRQGE